MLIWCFVDDPVVQVNFRPDMNRNIQSLKIRAHSVLLLRMKPYLFFSTMTSTYLYVIIDILAVSQIKAKFPNQRRRTSIGLW